MPKQKKVDDENFNTTNTIDKLLEPRKLQKTARLSLGQGLYSELIINYDNVLDAKDLEELLKDVEILKAVMEDIHTHPVDVVPNGSISSSAPSTTSNPQSTSKSESITALPSGYKDVTNCESCGSTNLKFVSGTSGTGKWYAYDCMDCTNVYNSNNGPKTVPTRNFCKRIKVDPKTVTNASNNYSVTDEHDIPF
jgi:transposase-like protein